MEINKQHVDGFLEVRASGRLDAYWADHLSKALEDMIRGGDDRIRMNLRSVEYMSSMGIRVLVTFYQKLLGINGTFVVVEPSEAVEKILDMVGLKATLMGLVQPDVAPSAAIEPDRRIERASARMDVYGLALDAGMSYGSLGDASLLQSRGYTADDCSTVLFPEDTIGIGLGAFGANFEEGRSRFGEFLAVAGAAAYQPSDGSNAPDYLLAQGSYVPELQVLYGLHCRGTFKSLGRFKTNSEARAVGLATLANMALDASGTDQAVFVMVGESAGLVGAALRKSPVSNGKALTPFDHPEIRNWLSFSTERAFSRALTVAVGVIARHAGTSLAPLMRPLYGSESVLGHVHAVAFPYRPLPRGYIDLRKTVRSLFEQETALGLLHLLGDDRGTSGVAESEFVRGACWIAPLEARA